MKQLEDQDASYLYLETPETPMHVGGLNLIELPDAYNGNFYDDYKAHIARRLHLVPLLTRKLLTLPLDLAHPLWVSSDALDIDYHVRQVTLPAPGTQRQLEEMVARLHSNPLDRSRPLWEFYVIDGLENGQRAIYTKIHHAAMDGAASQQLVTAMHDTTAVAREMPPPAVAVHKDDLAPGKVVEEVVRHFLRQEIRTAYFVPELMKAWAHLVLPDVDTLKYEGVITPAPRAPRTLFNVDITSQRAYAARTLQFSDIKGIAKQAHVTVNDVVLALCSTVLRRYLAEKGALPQTSLTAMVPISLRDANDKDAGNQNSMMICSLGTQLATAAQRLACVTESTHQQKRLIKNVRNLLVPELSFVGSGLVMRGLVDLNRRAKLTERLPLLANLFISNVQGPPVPLYLAGGRVLSFYPVSIPSHNAALNITVQSYGKSLDIGLTACRRTLPDIVALADLFVPALEELKAEVSEPLTSGHP